MSLLIRISEKLPGVKDPKRRLSFKKKLIWTASILVLYYVMSEIEIFGMKSSIFAQYKSLQAIIGSNIGSLVTLGIGPIVSASIILQLLVGSELLPWDLNGSEGKAKFQGTQKILAFLFAGGEAIAFVFFGGITAVAGAGITLKAIMALQVALGGWIIIFLDEVISKWGFGSGISLFIVAGVSKTIMIGAISPFTAGGAGFQGAIPGFIDSLVKGFPEWSALLPLAATLGIFALVVYAQSMRVEIPLTFGNVRGFGRKWPLKFVYTGVLPVIFVSALMTNLRMFGRMLSQSSFDLGLFGIHLFGTFSSQGAPTDPASIIYYLYPPSNFIINLIQFNVTGTQLLRVLIYTSTYIVGAIVFSIFWMKTSSQDAGSVADQIQNAGMKVPGFRKDKRVLVRVLNRYIPALAVLGGAFVGFLAAAANWLNVFGSGTGILLAVMIVFKLYQELAQQHMEDMHPALRKFMQSTAK